MGVVKTEEWLIRYGKDPFEICRRLTRYFPNASAKEIHHLLKSHGMYVHSEQANSETLQGFKRKKVWDIVKREEASLRKEWEGPDVPLFIFPSNSESDSLRRDANGKSGIAFHDKVFLFLSKDTGADELKALFTHEYNHVCRLAYSPKKEEDFVLLDHVILEGLAEQAVQERLGKSALARWTSHYSKEECEEMFRRYIEPNQNLSKHHPKYHQLLYGRRFVPRMAGYCVGYYLVNAFANKHRLTCKDLLHLPSESFLLN